MEDYVVINGKKYRKGYTTGSCAAASAKASVMMLFSGRIICSVRIDTPAGIPLTLPVGDAFANGNRAGCSVIKDGGDDPDVTAGLKIFAVAERSNVPGIEVKAGEGIGVATLPGLKTEAGKPAINPVPMKMILTEVGKVLPENAGVKITLSVPGGKEAAEKTYNPKLGIVGGISILGTSGIVTPMSEEAWKEALAAELSVLAARGGKTAIFVFGNYSEVFVSEKLSPQGTGIENGNIIRISNFLGFMLDKAVEEGIEKVLIAGHLGKLVKVAAGIFHTHSRIADARMEILSAYAALEGAPTGLVRRIYGCRTTEEAAKLIEDNGLNKVYDRIVASASSRCMGYVFNKIRAGCILFNCKNEMLAMDENAAMILEHIKKQNG